MQTTTNPSTKELTLDASRSLEWAVGKVVEDKAKWMYGEYFPAIRPTMQKFDARQLASFAVLEARTEGTLPDSGALTTWPSAEARKGFHDTDEFRAVQEQRDAAMEVLTDGHLIQSMDEVISVRTDRDYGVLICKDLPVAQAPIFTLPVSSDSPAELYAGRSLSLLPWSKELAAVMAEPPSGLDIFRIRFNS